MHLLNLSLVQFLAVFGSIAAVSVALYLLDRSRRRQVVSTLRFWNSAEQPAAAARRRRIQQPWSLILQLVSMALLLLAIAQLRWGAAAEAGRDHVLILDTSAWMAARSEGRTLMETARAQAARYLRSLPARDRVMLVRADALATPATAFEPDRGRVDAAIQASRPGHTALELDQALDFARRIQSQSGRRPGEIAFVGPGRTSARDDAAPRFEPANLRVIDVADQAENAGLRRIAARRTAKDPSIWEIYVTAKNYGARERAATVTLGAAQGGNALSKPLPLGPGAEVEAAFQYRAAGPARISVTLQPPDDFAADDSAQLDLPAQSALTVTVYSAEPESWRPVLSANPLVAAVYRSPSQYRPDDAGLVVLDRFIPPARPKADSLWIDPPPAGSPVPVRQTVQKAPVVRWDQRHPVAAGLRTRDLTLERASVFEARPRDARIGEVQAGPVIVALNGPPRIVVFGFHPEGSALRFQLATPLLLANVQRWVSPELFRQWEIAGGSVGTVRLALEEDVPASQVKVLAADGSALPFSLRDRVLHFFAGAPGTVRVTAADREFVYSLSLPQLWDARWQPPASAARGIPRFAAPGAPATDLWPWLAILGGMGLVAEWFLYGRGSGRRLPGRTVSRQARPRAKTVEIRR